MPQPTSAPILVLHSAPEELADVLQSKLPDETFVFVSSPDQVLPSLQTTKPEIVFSIKHSGFVGSAHRPVIDSPTVRWVQVGGSGYEHFMPWDNSKITVTNCHGVLAEYLAHTAIGALVGINQGLFRYHSQQRNKVWQGRTFKALGEQTLVIVGLGAIGQRMAEYAKKFGLTVIAVSQSQPDCTWVDEYVHRNDIQRALARADFVSLHLRASDDTKNLFNRTLLAALKPGAVFINTARGSLVDEQALLWALEQGFVSSAYLDVFAEEPLSYSSVLWTHPNVLISPHCADNVLGWARKFADVFVENVKRFRNKQELLHRVSP